MRERWVGPVQRCSYRNQSEPCYRTKRVSYILEKVHPPWGNGMKLGRIVVLELEQKKV